MAKKNEIVIRQGQTLIQQVDKGSIAVRPQHRIREHYTREQAIAMVCEAIDINNDPYCTTEQKQEAALLATEITRDSIRAMNHNG